MMFSKVVLCLALSTVLTSAEYAKSTKAVNDQKTTEAVVKAVIKAESKQEANAESNPEAAKNDKAATAVVKATTEVLEKQAGAKDVVSAEVVAAAAKGAKRTFMELKEAGVSSKAAAAAAAEVESATVDGASGLALTSEQKKNAEKAAVAAGKAVEDHPDNQASALTEALSAVKKEEKTTGKKVLDAPAKGVVAGTVAGAKDAVATASKAVSNLPTLAEGAVTGSMEAVENHPGKAFGIAGLLVIALPFVGGAVGYKFFGDKMILKAIDLKRGKDYLTVDAVTEEQQVPDIETQYAQFDEEMRSFP